MLGFSSSICQPSSSVSQLEVFSPEATSFSRKVKVTWLQYFISQSRGIISLLGRGSSLWLSHRPSAKVDSGPVRLSVLQCCSFSQDSHPITPVEDKTGWTASWLFSNISSCLPSFAFSIVFSNSGFSSVWH